MKLLNFLYWLQKKEFYLWVENNSLKFKQIQQLRNKEKVVFLLKQNKSKIINILNYNNVTSPNIKYPFIYKNNNRFPPLSFAQERLFFIDRYEQGTCAYNIPCLLKLNVKTDTELFENSIISIVNKHNILRTVYTGKNGVFFQKVKNEELVIGNYNVKTKVRFNNIIKKLVNHIIDLKNEIPVKVDFIEFKNETYIFILIHHIAFDGWSSEIFFHELNTYYSEKLSQQEDNQTRKLINRQIQYRDFAEWQRYYLTGENLAKQLAYWKKQLEGYENINLPTDKPRPAEINYSGNIYCFEVSEVISEKLKKLAKTNSTTLYCILLSAFYILLHKHTQQADLIIGTPIANRHFTQTKDIIGLFVNTLPIRVKINPENSIIDLIQQIIYTLSETQQHQDIPFEKIVNELKVVKELNRNSIFQVMFSLQEINDNAELYSHCPQNHFKNTAKFDLDFAILKNKNNISININYPTSLFTHTTIKRMAEHFNNILNFLADYINIPVRKLNILSSQEYHQIIYDWNKTEAPFPNDKTIHQLFEEQVEKTPDNIAVVFKNQKISYRELNNRANQLAHTIRKEYKNHWNIKIEADTLIGIYIDRSPEMIISILGILKAGAAYVPFDKADPKERLKFKINDCKCKMILTSTITAEKLTNISSSCNVLIINNKNIAQSPTYTPKTSTGSTNLAYMIYTSGTTGTPKGTMIEHRSYINYHKWLISYSVISRKDNIDNSLSIAFDGSITTYFSPLLLGAKIIICPDKFKKDIACYINYLNKNKISITKTTPSFFNLINSNYKYFPYLKLIILGGENINSQIIKEFILNNPKVSIVNEYGPTEATIGCSKKKFNTNSIPTCNNIGSPGNNTQLYILDIYLAPVPIGVIGELYIGGEGLARGYFRRSTLTKEKFIKNPFIPNKQIYRTGDLCKWLPNGEVEFIERNDNQVKINGLRIELGEIETKLAAHPLISQCAVTIHQQQSTNNKTLIAYYSVNKNIDIKHQALNEELKNYLSQRLPDYMVPNIYIKLEKLPLNTSGKIDRKILPSPDIKNNVADYIPPISKTEKQLTEICGNLLGIKKIGIKDNFFKLGGDSILSIQLSSRIRNLGYKISIKDIFEQKTIENLALLCAKKSINKTILLSEQGVLEGSFNLLPIQKWFFDNKFQQQNHWNQAFLIEIPTLDANKLENAISKLVTHHDILRIIFLNNTSQKYLTKIRTPKLNILDITNFTDYDIQKIFTQWQSCFNIYKEPLWSIAYIHGYKDNTARIFFAAHHLIIDVVSWRIIKEDLYNLYMGKKLHEKTSSYRQWVATINKYKKTHKLEQKYWDKIIIKSPDYSYLQTENIQASSLKLDNMDIAKLLQKNNLINVNINDLLLSALAMALHDVTGSKTNYITLEGHGREKLEKEVDVSNTLGWFTSMYPVKLEAKSDIRNTIIKTKETLRSIPNNGIGFGSLYGYRNLPKICFNYLGVFNSNSEKTSFWNITNESSGISINQNNMNNNIIDINCWKINDNLEFNIKTKLSAKKHNKFIQSFTNSLTKVIKHCSSETKTTSLMYDFNDFKNFTPYYFIKNNPKYKNVYLFPPSSGHAESYFNYILNSKNNFNKNFVIYNNLYLYLLENKLKYIYSHLSYEDLAKIYLKDIETSSNNEPYEFLGWSFGGILALEISKLLLNKGRLVKKIIFIDSYFSFNSFLKNSNMKSRDHISTEYSTDIDENKFKKTELILFKASIIEKMTDEEKQSYSKEAIKYIHTRDKYYLQTPDNNIKLLFKNTDIKIIKMNASHYNWQNDTTTINTLSSLINE